MPVDAHQRGSFGPMDTERVGEREKAKAALAFLGLSRTHSHTHHTSRFFPHQPVSTALSSRGVYQSLFRLRAKPRPASQCENGPLTHTCKLWLVIQAVVTIEWMRHLQ